ncbi:MAG: TetR/AcrR family transcriptional regulator, partial [Clostridiales bacterium]
MARKSYSEQEREQIRDKLLIAMLQCIAERGLIHSSIDVLCEKAGISKTFFYRFFSSKEELVLHALLFQQPKLLSYARSLMDNTDLSWRESVKTFLTNCCYGAKTGVAVLSIEDEKEIR